MSDLQIIYDIDNTWRPVDSLDMISKLAEALYIEEEDVEPHCGEWGECYLTSEPEGEWTPNRVNWQQYPYEWLEFKNWITDDVVVFCSNFKKSTFDHIVDNTMLFFATFCFAMIPIGLTIHPENIDNIRFVFLIGVFSLFAQLWFDHNNKPKPYYTNYPKPL